MKHGATFFTATDGGDFTEQHFPDYQTDWPRPRRVLAWVLIGLACSAWFALCALLAVVT
jgi:hypothetical protein